MAGVVNVMIEQRRNLGVLGQSENKRYHYRSNCTGNMLQFLELAVNISTLMEEGRVNNSKKSSGSGLDEAVKEFIQGLSEEHRMLVALKRQLYDGDWGPMLDDLRNRLAGKPYIFKLVNRIQNDVERIERMAEFEAEHSIDLADYIELT